MRLNRMRKKRLSRHWGAAPRSPTAVSSSTFPVQHHPGAHGATPPHLRRGAFKNSPPDSGGVARRGRGGYQLVRCKVGPQVKMQKL